jgi:8-oxo-dGTP diphosphatase
MRPDARIYVGLKAFIAKESKVLLLNDPNYGLDLPGGKIQEGEMDLTGALRREVDEETGLAIEVGRPFVTWFDPIHPVFVQTGVPVLLIGYGCRHVAGDVRLSEEHDAYRWIDLAEIDDVEDGSNYFAALKAYRDWRRG